MLAAASHRGPDGRGSWVSGPVAIGHLHLQSGRLAADRRQPLEAGNGSLVLSLDGRLDNRGELAAALGWQRTEREDVSDAELVLAAYRSWGEACAERLLGDFAFVLWDDARRQLLAARDALGVRTLFYHWDGSTLLVGSECGQLLALPAANWEPDEQAVRDLLRLRFQEVGRTFYRGVHRLPPAHVLVLRGTSLRLRRYWDAPMEPEPGAGSEAEYAERFRDLFKQAVRDRLDLNRPVGCLFSGGVDSSCVLSMAHALSDEVPASLKAFSTVFKQAPVDDRQYIDLVSGRYGTDLHVCAVPRVGPVRDLDRMLEWTGSPLVDAHHPMLDSMLGEASRGGCRVILTGLRGDDLFGGLGQLADLTRRLRLGRALAELRAWAPVMGGRPVRLAWRLCLKPLAKPPRPPFRSHAAEEAHELLVGPFTVLSTEIFQLVASRWGLEPAYPFWDRRLVELMLSAPPELRAAGGVTKRVLRHALVGIVPQPILERRDKLSLTPQFRRGLVEYDKSRLRERLAGLHPVVEQQVSRRQVDRMLSELLAGRGASLLKLWFVVCMNAWLNRFEGATPQGDRRHALVVGERLA